MIYLKKLIIIIPIKKLKIFTMMLVGLICIMILYICFKYHTLYAIPTANNSNDITLLEAYEKNNEEKAYQYFKNWNVESKKQIKLEHKDPLEENLYDIFQTVFRPYELDSLSRGLGLGSVGINLNELIRNNPFIVIQDKLNYAIYDFNNLVKEDDILISVDDYLKREDIKYIEDFKPLIASNQDKLLYLSKKYEDELLDFLGSEEYPFGTGNIMSPAFPKAETLNRYKFLSKYIPILYGHWGGYWHLSTHPEIYLVVINEAMNEAVAYYRIGYRFGRAELKKQNNEWILVEAKMTGME